MPGLLLQSVLISQVQRNKLYTKLIRTRRDLWLIAVAETSGGKNSDDFLGRDKKNLLSRGADVFLVFADVTSSLSDY